ncbi:unnamed protein product (macronuclear) [Paramecium tetraurelia]|uniref:DUF4200 domain-containing protein n=1 Tax=Paramecium tetraurelia TaxID=5888 RepID=A0CBU0_PARTE|nr:uncharacterized protein GSPATT00037040001 [Paramecium tetraurelia]CAK68257.1 unnamed protein product [Paramecium tetraurelia]|eukprot:XP_001435654.1 hypothetical protein (macronuclear) [Paramecium tetraurelia strain d4-2]
MNKQEKRKLPNHLQYDTVSPATKLLEKRRKMYEVHEAFEAQREEFKKQEDKFKLEEEKIRQKDMEIQESLIKFCKFLQDNEAKKKRAEGRLEEERRQKIQKEKEIQDLNGQLQELEKKQQKLEKKVTSMKKYEEYLDSVAKQYPEQYHDMASILERHSTLSSQNQKLVEEHQSMEKEYETLKYILTQSEKDKSHEILQFNNDIKELQKKLEEKVAERNQLYQLVEASANEASSKNLSLGRILMAIDNLFNRCQEGTQKIKHELEETKQENNKKEDKKVKKEDSKKQQKDEKKEEEEDNYEVKSQQAMQKLKIISLYLNDFKKIIQGCKEDYKKAQNK